MDNQHGAAPRWTAGLKTFERPDGRRALLQLADTLLPYLAGLLAMLFALRLLPSPWLALLLAIPAGGFMVRTFILFHDCCHGSFLPSRRANDALGAFLGILVFTPFADWRRSHGRHHQTTGQLDERGIGDVWTMTVAEYRAAGRAKRLLYRFYRNPLTLFVLGPFFIFLLINRFPSKGAGRRQKRDLVFHNLALLLFHGGMCLVFGVIPWVLVQASVLLVGGLVGIWMFYVQHQFDPTWWARGSEWSFVEASFQGSSWYRLPRPLQWMTGNIGLHHVHHLNPRIPNYRLQDCLEAIPELRLKKPLGFLMSLRAISLKLWDENRRALVPFSALRGPA